MPGILDLVQQSLGPDAVQAISQQLGTNPQQAQSAIGAALPMLLAGMAHHAQGDGADAIHAAVTQHDGSLLDNVAGVIGSGGGTDAAGLLQTVLGQHQGTAQAAVAGATGLESGQAQQLLGMLAPLVMSAASRVQQQGGLDPSALSNLLQGEHQQLAQAMGQGAPGLLGLAEQMLGQQGGGLLGGLTKGLGGLLGGNS